MGEPTQTGVTPTYPACEAPLMVRAAALHCRACGEPMPVVDGSPRVPAAVEQPAIPVVDALAAIADPPLWVPVVSRVIGNPRAPRR